MVEKLTIFTLYLKNSILNSTPKVLSCNGKYTYSKHDLVTDCNVNNTIVILWEYATFNDMNKYLSCLFMVFDQVPFYLHIIKIYHPNHIKLPFDFILLRHINDFGIIYLLLIFNLVADNNFANCDILHLNRIR